MVIFFNMRREAERTLFSLSEKYQQDVDHSDYEVIAIDNGSNKPLDEAIVQSMGPNFRYHYFDTDSVSPVDAVNYGAEIARGKFIACIVDGARMASPGILKYTFAAIRGFRQPLIGALSWHLGPKIQNESMLDGYDQTEEDRLLDSIDWRSNGYGLFDISTIAPSSNCGFLGGLPTEYSFFSMSKRDFLDMGGFDANFQSPGGGLVNHDFLQRAVKWEKPFELIMLLGEGVFHQYHGGIATNCKPSEHPQTEFENEYVQIHKTAFSIPPLPDCKDILYLGSLSENSRHFF